MAAPGRLAGRSGCRGPRYCFPACWRAAWRGRRRAPSGRAQRVAPQSGGLAGAGAQQAGGPRGAPGQRGSLPQDPQPTTWTVRCPAELLGGTLPRLERLDGSRAQEMMCEGEAFVAPMEGLLGRRLLKWNFQYLEQHLPANTKYGVMLDEGSGKIVMSHSARNGQRTVDMADVAAAHGKQRSSDEGLFGTSDQTRMTFTEFLQETERFESSNRQGTVPYFGLHLLWRFKPSDNGYVGQIDEEMLNDLWSINFCLIKEWQDVNVLPLIQRFYLFAGVGGTLYHCHYDLQPNLHVQLSGRKRFVLFPPEDWQHLYPFPVHHDLDRRSMLDLDRPDTSRFPKWRGAHGHVIELNPGDALYIPPFWWHHVQSISERTTSMAMWFFEHYPLSADVSYGLGPRASALALMRDVEELVGRCFPDAPGEEDATKSRPTKAGQVAAFMSWLRPRLQRPPADDGDDDACAVAAAAAAAADAGEGGCGGPGRGAASRPAPALAAPAPEPALELAPELAQLARPAVEVEAALLRLVQERCGEAVGAPDGAADGGAAGVDIHFARRKVLSFLEGRFHD